MMQTTGQWLAGAALLAGLFPLMAAAQNRQPILVQPAQYGTVHEVNGAELPIAVPRANCPAKWQPVTAGPCFDKVVLKPAAQGETRVLGLSIPAPGHTWVSGTYGSNFKLYDLFPTAEGVQIRPLDLPTSEVSVPRDCYALPGEDVHYFIEARKSGDVAVESQIVACGGGPRSRTGPYRPEGPPLPPERGGWHITEMLMVEGTPRYLAFPGKCDPQYSLKTTYCAQPGVSYLQANPEVKELDLIAAKRAVRAGDILRKNEIDQWVLKRKSGGKFKADNRWIDKSYLSGVEGCWPVEDVGWRVIGGADGLSVREQALNRCGAPMVPVPTEIWEAYGDDLFIVDCSDRRDWRKGRARPNDGHGKSPGDQAVECFDSARDYLRKTGQTRATVVVLNERARPDDRLFSGSYVSYDVAEISFNADKTLSARRLDYFDSYGVSMMNCAPVNDGPPESKGFVIVRSMGISWARSYRWMNCPVY